MDTPTLAVDVDSTYLAVLAEHHDLDPRPLHKHTLLWLSWAIEDELIERAESPVVVGAFQDARYWGPAAPRWRELAQMAPHTVVMADFLGRPPVETGIDAVDLPPAHSMCQEWTVAGDAPGFSALLAARELPDQDHVPDRERVFDAVWTVDPRATRTACLLGLEVAAVHGVERARTASEVLRARPVVDLPNPTSATMLFRRALAYSDRRATRR